MAKLISGANGKTTSERRAPRVLFLRNVYPKGVHCNPIEFPGKEVEKFAKNLFAGDPLKTYEEVALAPGYSGTDSGL